MGYGRVESDETAIDIIVTALCFSARFAVNCTCPIRTVYSPLMYDNAWSPTSMENPSQ